MIAAKPDAAGPPPASWREIEAALPHCTRCPIGCNGTRAVPGEGPRKARLMIVGEQPGDVEEQMGRPFVGPAGKLLDGALAQAGIARDAAYLTNAVKHFKFELREGSRGKRRLHKTPSPREIDICRWWLAGEAQLVKPDLTITLGASAARAVFGRTVKIGEARGKIAAHDGGARVLVTVHPSYLLRLPDADRRQQEYDRFVADLTLAARWLAKPA